MKVLLVSSYAPSLLNFRGDLICALVKNGCDVTALGPEPGFETELEKIGARYCRIRLNRTSMNPASDTLAFFSLVATMLHWRPDIVLSYTPKPVIYGSFAARFIGVPKIYSIITGLGTFFVKKRGLQYWLAGALMIRLYKSALQKNTAIFFQNPDDFELFTTMNIVTDSSRRVLVNGSGINLERFSMAPPQDRNVSFLMLSRLIREKGVEEYVAAAAALKRKYQAVSFKLLGFFDSKPSAITREMVESWTGAGIIDYLGVADDVRPFIAGSSVVVLPSYYREGVPRSLMEAMAMGRPIVTTDMPGCRETVVDGQNGFLVPVKKVTELSDAMEKFIVNPKLVAPMGIAGRQMAIEKFDVNKVNDIILRTLKII